MNSRIRTVAYVPLGNEKRIRSEQPSGSTTLLQVALDIPCAKVGGFNLTGLLNAEFTEAYRHRPPTSL